MPAPREVDNVASIKEQISSLFKESLQITVPDEAAKVAPLIAPCTRKGAGDYQCNNTMSVWSLTKHKGSFKGPQLVGKAIVDNLPPADMIESCLANGVFINVTLSTRWLTQSIVIMLTCGIDIWAPRPPVKTAVVDFSSPNIAKEMHVGHLRSTIIGDTLACILEFCKVKVGRRNHVGDWGTQFGMLIEFLLEKCPDGNVNIGELEEFYKNSKKRFDTDAEFKKRAQQAVVSLQGGDEKYRKVWALICEISRNGFQKVYQRLGVRLEEKGESFYNPFIPETLDLLRQQNLIKEDDGAQVIFIEGHKTPLIVEKSDGGFNYASTDLAALRYRIEEEKAEWIIYVTDVGQQEHFDKLFSVGKRAGWLPSEEGKYPKASHVGFGLVCGDDGKRFRTRSSEVVKLVDLLDEAKARAKAALVERGKAAEWTAEELEQTAEAIGYGAVKYADLKNNRLTNYTFNFDQMLNDKGNTAVYLLYTHARICSIIRKSGKDIAALNKEGQLILGNDEERTLGLHICRFTEAVEEAGTKLLPNVLCKYLYELAEKFTSFYTVCQVIGSPEETSRLILCEATVVVMRKCFNLLGITPIYKI